MYSKSVTAFDLVALVGSVVMAGFAAGEPREASPNEPARDGIVQSHDFGTVDPGKALEHEFQIHNATDDDIVITRHRVSCSCVSVVASPDSIPPGESRAVVLRLATDDLHGQNAQTCVFNVQNPRLNYIGLRLSSLVSGIWSMPVELDFGTSDDPAIKQRHIDLYSAGMQDVKVSSIQVDDDWLSVKSDAVKTDESTSARDIRALCRIVVDCEKAQLPPGLHRTHINVFTNQSPKPAVRVPVTVHLIGATGVRPPRILFGKVVVGDEVRRACTVSLPSEVAERVQDLEFAVEHPCVKVSLERDKSTRNAEVVLKLNGENKFLGLIKGTAIGRIDGAPRISIPYIGYVSN